MAKITDQRLRENQLAMVRRFFCNIQGLEGLLPQESDMMFGGYSRFDNAFEIGMVNFVFGEIFHKRAQKGLYPQSDFLPIWKRYKTFDNERLYFVRDTGESDQSTMGVWAELRKSDISDVEKNHCALRALQLYKMLGVAGEEYIVSGVNPFKDIQQDALELVIKLDSASVIDGYQDGRALGFLTDNRTISAHRLGLDSFLESCVHFDRIPNGLVVTHVSKGRLMVITNCQHTHHTAQPGDNVRYIGVESNERAGLPKHTFVDYGRLVGIINKLSLS